MVVYTICAYNLHTRAGNRGPRPHKIETRVRIHGIHHGEEIKAWNCWQGDQKLGPRASQKNSSNTSEMLVVRTQPCPSCRPVGTTRA